MNGFSINTQNLQFVATNISNVHLFTYSTGKTSFSFTSTSNIYEDLNNNKNSKKNYGFYTINLDLFQLICVPRNNTLMVDKYKGSFLCLERTINHKNPNFRYCYKIYYHGFEVSELFTCPLNDKHLNDEVSFKVNNAILYLNNWTYLVEFIVNELDLRIKRMEKLAIAIDGNSNLKILDYCRRYLRNHTIQINNDKIKITPKDFTKTELRWSGYLIGCKKYEKFARVYDKTKEIKKSGKTYIMEFWKQNGLTDNNVGRFELELGHRHLKKYKFNTIHEFGSCHLMTQLIHDEVQDWLKFYKVKLVDIKTKRKDVALRKAKELEYVKWSKLPNTSYPLETITIFPNDMLNAKKSITFALKELRKNPNANDTYQTFDYIMNVTMRYNLENYLTAKIKYIFKDTLLPDCISFPVIDYSGQILKNLPTGSEEINHTAR